MDEEPHSSLWSKLAALFSRSDDNLKQAILEARADGEVEAEEGSMLLSILRLDDMQVQDIMTPRTDIDCVEMQTPLADVARVIVESGHSRIPVYQDTRDNITSIVYAKDLLQSLLEPEQSEYTVSTLGREPFFVPETKAVLALLDEFRARKIHLAIVLDEYGGTAGLVTIEDVLEVIVGDIEDEHDSPREEDIRPLGDDRYDISGRTALEDLQELGIHIESDEVDTIGGYLSLQSGKVPQNGDHFSVGEWSFTVTDADPKQIHHILLAPLRLGEE